MFVVLVAAPVLADSPLISETKLTPLEAAGYECFGRSVMVSGDTAVVGAPYNDAVGDDAGCAYVYERNAGGPNMWGEVAQLSASDAAAGHGFGWSVAISGDTIVVGAGIEVDAGAVYVFERDAGGADMWGEVTKLTASDGAALDFFGCSVSISGDTVVVGAPRHSAAAQFSGAAYVFGRDAGGSNTWGEVTKLTASDAESNDWFGGSVSISGSTTVVGAYQDDDAGYGAGSAYVFDRDAGGADMWGQVAKLTALDTGASDQFGRSVSISGDSIVIGAPGHAGFLTGAAYVFEYFGAPFLWAEVAKLTASDVAINDYFGESVSISGDWVAVGAPGSLGAADLSSSAYVFGRDAGGADMWGEVATLTRSDVGPNQLFGHSVSISGESVLAGSPRYGPGASYVFDRNTGGPDAWGEVIRLTASDAAGRDQLGNAVSISGDTAVVGVRLDDAGRDRGSAYIFERDAGGADMWGEVARLTLPVYLISGGNHFASSVSVSNDTVVVGDPVLDGHQQGAVHVFDRNAGGTDAWGQVAIWGAVPPVEHDHFGHSLSLSGDNLVVGAPFDGPGSAHIFYRNAGGSNGWGHLAKLTASDGTAEDVFGWSVSIWGDYAVVGALLDDGAGINAGAAYIFHRHAGGIDNWGEVRKLTASDAVAEDFFGWSVSIWGDIVVVGAHGTDDHGSLSGSAYLFGRDTGGANNWGQIKKITASDAAAGDLFGWSVSISGLSAYVFERDAGGANNWGEVTKLTASDAAPGDAFGSAVSISGDSILIGAPSDDDRGIDSGSAYVFDEQPCVGDIDDSGDVGVDDLIAVVMAWGPCPPFVACPADVDGNFEVDVDDLLAVITNWGPCP
jgi:hypothetical protein